MDGSIYDLPIGVYVIRPLSPGQTIDGGPASESRRSDGSLLIKETQKQTTWK